MSISRLLIANRGEIAVRIVKAARELGMRTIQIHSSVDAGSLAVQNADEAVEIKSASAARCYLDAAEIVQAAKEAKADAIHPGYGFLSENAAFAQAVAEAGIIFVGPDADTLERLGDKANARAIAVAAGAEVVPGSGSRIESPAEAARIAAEIGFPVMLKAASGGGGRGIRVAEREEDLERQFAVSATEARAAFGDGGLYLEKRIENARHIEVQVLGDGSRAVHCFERECSLQRRRQKIWEEAPAVFIPEQERARLCEGARRLAQEIGYRGAGTFEYLYDPASRKFYFIEANTRIQVEHPVTEMVTGLDLIQEMLKIAGGAPLSLQQEEIRLNGHAIECRINAEDPDNDFLPQPGRITSLDIPDAPGVRFDSHIFDGYEIPPFYDSLLGKLIVHAADRQACLERLRGALDELDIGGITTTAKLHEELARDPAVSAGRLDIDSLEIWLAARAQSRRPNHAKAVL